MIKSFLKPLASITVCFVVILAAMYSCSSSAPSTSMTKRLFLQSQRAHIELPPQDDFGTDPATKQRFLSEVISYVNPNEVNPLAGNAKVDTKAVYRLSEVVVMARSRYTAERNGRVNIDFVVKVPKAMLSPAWQITITPRLIYNDTVQALKDVVVKGQEFLDKQKADYQAYDDYLNSIVNKSQYDSIFLDTRGIKKDIRDRQEFFYQQYQKEWARQMEYENWKRERDEQIAYYAARREAYINKLYNEYAIKEQEQIVRDLAQGKDTTGIHEKYQKEFRKKSDNQYEYWVKREKALRIIPKKFQDIIESGRSLEDITNDFVAESDSASIAQHRYLYDQIAENEMKAERKEEKFRELVIFPYSEGARIDTVINPSEDFVYYYHQDFPVVQGLKQISLTMEGKVDAVDRSRFTIPPLDTLKFYISSLSQLADTTLIYKETMLRRNVFNKGTAYTEYPPNGWTFDARYGNNKAEIDKIIGTFRNFKDNKQLVIDSVQMTATSSLDGAFQKNAELSKKRVLSVKEYIVKNLPDVTNADLLFKASYKGEDWNTLGLNIMKRNDIQHKNEIIEMLSNATDPDECEKNIKKTYRDDYRLIQDSIYPLLRKVDFIFSMHRKDLESDSLHREIIPEYVKGLQLLQDRKYWEAIEILANYPDFNAALCLASIGQDEKAYEVLKRLEPNGNTEYLMSIVLYRLKREEEAADHLLRACQLDPSKTFRVSLDTEAREIFVKYNIQDKLNNSSVLPVGVRSKE